MTTSALALQATVTADAAGTATASFGPVPAWCSWRVRSTSIRSTSTARTQAAVYRNTVTDTNQLDVAPYSGNADTTDTVFELHAGESLIVQWTGADAGASCTVNATGDQLTTT